MTARLLLLLALVAGANDALARNDPVRDWLQPALEIRTGRDNLSVRGHVANSTHQQNLLSALSALSQSSGTVHAELRRHVMLPDYWRELSLAIVPVMTALHSGRARLERDQLVVSGTLDGLPPSAALETLKSTMPAGMQLELDLSDLGSVRRADACSTLLGGLLGESFEYLLGESDVPGSHKPRLNRLALAVQLCPGTALRITGHADGTGDAGDNLRISERRAQAVRSYLVEKGAPDDAMQAEGRGSAEPVASNRTAAGRNRNRRVSIEIYSPGP